MTTRISALSASKGKWVHAWASVHARVLFCRERRSSGLNLLPASSDFISALLGPFAPFRQSCIRLFQLSKWLQTSTLMHCTCCPRHQMAAKCQPMRRVWWVPVTTAGDRWLMTEVGERGYKVLSYDTHRCHVPCDASLSTQPLMKINLRPCKGIYCTSFLYWRPAISIKFERKFYW